MLAGEGLHTAIVVIIHIMVNGVQCLPQNRVCHKKFLEKNTRAFRSVILHNVFLLVNLQLCRAFKTNFAKQQASLQR